MKRLLTDKSEKQAGALAEVEWSFHRVIPDEREACLLYECCREALRNTPEGCEYAPWLHLPKSQRRVHVKGRSGRDNLSSVRDVAYMLHLLRMLPPAVTEEWLNDGIYPGRAKTLAVLEIDWSVADSQLKSDFEEWIGRQRAEPGSMAFKYNGGKSKPGPKEDVNRELVDLAIYRSRKSGNSTKLTKRLLSPLFDGLNYYFRGGVLTAQGIRDACDRARKLIRRLMPGAEVF